MLEWFLFGFVLNFAMAWWVYNDLKERIPEHPKDPIAWPIVVILFGIIAFVLYFLHRPTSKVRFT